MKTTNNFYKCFFALTTHGKWKYESIENYKSVTLQRHAIKLFDCGKEKWIFVPETKLTLYFNRTFEISICGKLNVFDYEILEFYKFKEKTI